MLGAGAPSISVQVNVRVLAVMAMGGLSACADAQPPRQIAGADPDRGLAVIERVGCAACHDIPGIDWPRGTAGGTLSGLAGRPLLAGRFPNQPEALVGWIRNAPAMSQATAMPASPVSEAEARDIAAYLYAQDAR